MADRCCGLRKASLALDQLKVAGIGSAVGKGIEFAGKGVDVLGKGVSTVGGAVQRGGKYVADKPVEALGIATMLGTGAAAAKKLKDKPDSGNAFTYNNLNATAGY